MWWTHKPTQTAYPLYSSTNLIKYTSPYLLAASSNGIANVVSDISLNVYYYYYYWMLN